MNSVIIIAGIVFVPDNLVSETLIAYHKGNCCGVEEEAESLGYKFQMCMLDTDIRQYTLKKDYTL